MAAQRLGAGAVHYWGRSGCLGPCVCGKEGQITPSRREGSKGSLFFSKARLEVSESLDRAAHPGGVTQGFPGSCCVCPSCHGTQLIVQLGPLSVSETELSRGR